MTKGLISTTSPIGRGLVGKQVGDVAVIHTPNGKRELEVLKLTTIHDEAEAADASRRSSAPVAARKDRNDLDQRLRPRLRLAS